MIAASNLYTVRNMDRIALLAFRLFPRCRWCLMPPVRAIYRCSAARVYRFTTGIAICRRPALRCGVSRPMCRNLPTGTTVATSSRGVLTCRRRAHPMRTFFYRSALQTAPKQWRLRPIIPKLPSSPITGCIPSRHGCSARVCVWSRDFERVSCRQNVGYFSDYCRQYTDMPLLVRLEQRADGRLVPERFLRASDLSGLDESNNPEWKTLAYDENAAISSRCRAVLSDFVGAKKANGTSKKKTAQG
jgi:hypothetical protein